MPGLFLCRKDFLCFANNCDHKFLKKMELKLTHEAKKYLDDIRSNLKIRLYFLKNLPTAFWWGLKVIEASPAFCKVSIPFNWRTQNPFNSIYFAALAGAGELATGTLANMARLGKGSISMLVVDQRAEFVKKADGKIIFTCNQGLEAHKVVDEAIATGEGKTITMTATGANLKGETVCKIHITWSFRKRTKK
ncbi:MAG: DUF4442 domain-containing protein [Bacteroidetes bacterium]|nr:MAG: DUF4442 domain-containing protein [Bacteroidota bacterium]